MLPGWPITASRSTWRRYWLRGRLGDDGFGALPAERRAPTPTRGQPRADGCGWRRRRSTRHDERDVDVAKERRCERPHHSASLHHARPEVSSADLRASSARAPLEIRQGRLHGPRSATIGRFAPSVTRRSDATAGQRRPGLTSAGAGVRPHAAPSSASPPGIENGRRCRQPWRKKEFYL